MNLRLVAGGQTDRGSLHDAQPLEVLQRVHADVIASVCALLSVLQAHAVVWREAVLAQNVQALEAIVHQAGAPLPNGDSLPAILANLNRLRGRLLIVKTCLNSLKEDLRAS